MAGSSNSGGHNKKPTALKELSGTVQKCRTNADAPELPAVTNYSMPANLNLTEHGESVWNELSADLITAGILKKTDLQGFAVYCNAFGLYMEMAKFIQDNGVTYLTEKLEPKKRPEVSIMNDAIKTVITYQGRFGLTPVDRERIHIEKEKDNTDLGFLK